MIGSGRPADQPPRAGPSQPTAGPSLPPHLRQAAAEASDDEDDDDDYTPALPPGMPARTAQGPALPPHLANRRRSPSPVSADDSDDSDVGPTPAPSAGPAPSLSAAEEFRLREQRKQEEEEEERRIAGQKPKREAWMTVPPSALDSLAHQDPTKITKRGFNQSSRQGAAGKPADGAASLWTETPQERAKRIDDEIMGKRKRIENATKEETESERIERKKREARDAHMRSQTEAYNTAASRTSTLVDVHQKKTAEEQEEERRIKKSKKKHRKASRSPSPEAPAFWDREKMMGHGGRMMEASKRREIIGTSSVDLGTKFGSGSYL